ncbi:MAG: TraR/DksA family transcriptional regulator [Halofilum sp. (in: g-proteobacteria)]
MTAELTRDQMTELKDKLIVRRAELREIIHNELLEGTTETHAELAGQVHDAEDAALADLLVDAQLAEIDRHVEEVRRIENALQRISLGTYGECSDCGRPVALERLRAWPTAERCIDCQTLYERTHSSQRRNTL